MSDAPAGIVFDIQRFCLHDGPGVRTTVFLKGCNLRCAWCHNPESIAARPHVVVALARCAGCGGCRKACPAGAVGFVDGRPRVDIERCVAHGAHGACDACVGACPTGAASVSGRAYTVDEVMAVAEKDRAYYAKSGGGVTFSGGEPTRQFAFLRALARRAKAAGWHTAVETNGITAPERVEALAADIDLFLLDYKLTGDALHRRHTGASNRAVAATLSALDRLDKAVTLRCPIIPGLNDTESHFSAIRALRTAHPSIRAVEIMPYHAGGAAKWNNIGLPYALSGVPTPTAADRRRWTAMVAGGP